jgi:hypothetical protein
VGINVNIETVTPELARAWLGQNERNRPRRKTQVQNLAEIIRRGEWQINGDPIRFAEDGTLLDGQHRLHAVVEADIAISTIVIRGLPAETQHTMDNGLRRALSDALSLAGEKNASNLAAACNLIHVWAQGDAVLRSRTGFRLSAPQAFALLEKYPEIRVAVQEATRIRSKMNNTIRGSILAACWFRFSTLDQTDCEDFFTRLADGENLHSGDPIYTLRRAVYKNAQRQTGVRPIVQHAWVVKAWNAYREHRKIETVAWRTGANAEPFPEPV